MTDFGLVSVIIPVYNTEKYIRKCINSVLNQDYTNLEIVLVDDGSTDTSGDICDDYAKIDNRVKVIHQKNSGQATARNTALRVIRGVYLAFLDSDDFWEVDYISYLLNILYDNNADLCVCGIKHIGFPDFVDSVNSINTLCYCSGDDIIYNMLLGKNGFSVSACRMITKTSLCKNLTFIDGVVFEDLDFIISLGMKVDNAVSCTTKKYNYVYHEDNSSSLPIIKKINDLEYVINVLKNKLLNKSSDLIKCLNNRRYITNLINFLTFSECKSNKKLFYEIRKKILNIKIERKLVNKATYILYNSLSIGRIPFFIVFNLINFIKKIRNAIFNN